MAHIAATTMNSAEFSLLFSQYRSHFVVVARSYVREQMVAEDIVADCFMSFWENREKITLEVSAPAYILASIKNRCLNWLRDRNAHLQAQQNIHSDITRVIESRISTLETCDPNALFAQEVALIIEQQLERMPQRMRDIFVANHYREMTYKEISALYDISENQVNYEMRTAKSTLRQALKDYLPMLFF